MVRKKVSKIKSKGCELAFNKMPTDPIRRHVCETVEKICSKFKDWDTDLAVEYENIIYNKFSSLYPDMNEEIKDEYKNFAYEKIGEISVCDTEEKIAAWKQDDNIGYDCSVYKDLRNTRTMEIVDTHKPVKAVKGVYVCKNMVPGLSGSKTQGKKVSCGNDEFVIWELQTRSCDEPMTKFRQCTKCGARGRE